MPAPSPVELDEPRQDEVTRPDRPWIVLVWNDPINLMSYVTFVFQKLFGYSKEKAEIDVFRLHEHGLWATMQQDDG
ncbi:MAG: ATP-dependent Clp protease adaptor ClpS [Ilumatobacteraceae bacterium]